MIYFIGGKKQRKFKYFEILEKIRKENAGIGESFFDVELKENEKFLEKININSIFASQELIVLKRAEKLKNIEEILKYIANLEIVNKEIIIDYNREDGKFGVKLKKLLDEFNKNKQMEVFLFQKETEEEIRDYVANELEINPKDVAILLQMIGNDPFNVRNEVEKIKVFLNGEKFDIKKIKNVVSVQKEYQIYEMTRNILLNNPMDVMRYLEQKKEYTGILYSLYNELETMYKISSLKMKGRKFSKNYNIFKTEFEEIKEIFKSNNRIPNSYVIFKKLELEQNYTNRNLKRLVFRCWEIEKDIKTGKIEMETGIETLIMEICSLFRKKWFNYFF